MNDPNAQQSELEMLTLYSTYFRESPIPRRIFLRPHITAWIVEELLYDSLRSGDAYVLEPTGNSSRQRLNG